MSTHTAPRTAPVGTGRALVPAAGARGRELAARSSRPGAVAGAPRGRCVAGRLEAGRGRKVGADPVETDMVDLQTFQDQTGIPPLSPLRDISDQTDHGDMPGIPDMPRITTHPHTRHTLRSTHPHTERHTMPAKTSTKTKTTDRQSNRNNTGRQVRVPDPLWEEFGDFAHNKLGVSAAERIRYLMQRDLDQHKS